MKIPRVRINNGSNYELRVGARVRFNMDYMYRSKCSEGIVISMDDDNINDPDYILCHLRMDDGEREGTFAYRVEVIG